MACLALALLAAGRASALGLGDAVGSAVVGEPLRIEIPLLGSGAEAPSPACFRVGPPLAEMGNDFVLRNARVDVVAERGGSKLVVTTAAPIREPLVGFALSAACGYGLTRDYVLLASVGAPAAAPVAPPSVQPAVAPRPVQAPEAAPPRAAAPIARAGGESLRIGTDITFDALAKQKYPLQPKAREKFMRMMARANPGLGDADAVIAAGTVLQVPPGLPLRREAGVPAQAKPPAPAKAAPAPAAEAPPAKAAAAAPNPKKDRLVLGRAPSPAAADLLAEAERLTTLVMEQSKAQDTLLENIARLEADVSALRKDYARIEQRLAQIEAERKAEKEAAAKPLSLDFVALLVAVLAGGALGGLALRFYQRRQLKRGGDNEPAALPARSRAAAAAVAATPTAAATPAAAVVATTAATAPAPELPLTEPASAAPAPAEAPPSPLADLLDFHTSQQK